MEKCKVESLSNSRLKKPQGRCLIISSKTDSNHREDETSTAAAAVVVSTQHQYKPPLLLLPEQVKMAAVAISLNIRLRSADMPPAMQQHALRHTSSILHMHMDDQASSNSVSPTHRQRRPNLTLLACSLKQEFDKVYGPAWHCVAGKSFGSFVTHTPGGFLYFTTLDDSLCFLLFKTEVHLVPL